MVNTYVKKRRKPDVLEVVMQEAIRAVKERRFPKSCSFQVWNDPYSVVLQNLKKVKYVDKCNQPSGFTEHYTSQQVFNENQELKLVDYVIKCSKLNYGMTHKPVCQLSYDYGRRLDGKFPSSWTGNKIAGTDWLQSFMKRHRNLTFRKPENTSLFRATVFSKTYIMEFLKNYECALKS
jgi:hypothetical protein